MSRVIFPEGLSATVGKLSAVLAMLLALTALPPAQAQGIIRDAEIEEILRDYTNPILEAAGLQPEDVGLYIIDDPSLNAFVANGQRIHLFTGLIIASETPEQLMGVIAHEAGHITGAHGARRARDMQVAARPAYVSIGLGLLALAAGEGEAGAALLASSQQFAALNFFVHTRVQEASADQAAVRFLDDAGISARGLIAFFEKYRYQEVLSQQRRFEYFRTHPLSSDRIQSLRSAAERTTSWDAPSDPKAVAQLEIMRAKLIGWSQTPGHVMREYPLSDTSVPAKYARAINAYRNADMGTALRNMDELIAVEPENPYFLEFKAQVLVETGDAEAAIAPAERAVALSDGHPLIRVLLAQALVGRGDEGDLVRAEEELRAALRAEPGNGFALRQLARTLEKQGRRAEAELATAELAYSVGDLQRANIFAGRAMKDLEAGTPLWVRASDIQAATDPRLPENEWTYRQRRR
jgi:predicted Zn-dependent protease